MFDSLAASYLCFFHLVDTSLKTGGKCQGKTHHVSRVFAGPQDHQLSLSALGDGNLRHQGSPLLSDAVEGLHLNQPFQLVWMLARTVDGFWSVENLTPCLLYWFQRDLPGCLLSQVEFTVAKGFAQGRMPSTMFSAPFTLKKGELVFPLRCECFKSIFWKLGTWLSG